MSASLFTSIDISYQLALGKKVQVYAGTGAMTGSNNVTLHMTFIRGAEGATIAAA